MSDIYLSLTETPSVVTLSQPVIASSVAATVTVGNTVTVALDANSLSALENVTVTVGSSVALAAGSAQIGSVTVSNFPSTQTIAGTVTANVPLSTDGYTAVTGVRVIGAGLDGGLRIQGINPSDSGQAANLEEGGAIPVVGAYGNPLPISGTVTVGNAIEISAGVISIEEAFGENSFMPISGTVTVGNSVTIGSLPAISGTVTANLAPQAKGPVIEIDSAIPADPKYMAIVGGLDANGGETRALQLGSSGGIIVQQLPAISGTVTANLGVNTSEGQFIAQDGGGILQAGVGISYRTDITDNGVPYLVSESQPFPVRVWGGTVTIGSLPAISGTVTIGAVSTSVTVAQIQGTSVTTSNFTSTTASQTLVSANSSRRGLTVFNEGAGNLHICAGATATTLAYQVRLSAGDYWECPSWQTALTHSAQFASTGTARIVEIL